MQRSWCVGGGEGRRWKGHLGKLRNRRGSREGARKVKKGNERRKGGWKGARKEREYRLSDQARAVTPLFGRGGEGSPTTGGSWFTMSEMHPVVG